MPRRRESREEKGAMRRGLRLASTSWITPLAEYPVRTNPRGWLVGRSESPDPKRLRTWLPGIASRGVTALGAETATDALSRGTRRALHALALFVHASVPGVMRDWAEAACPSGP